MNELIQGMRNIRHWLEKTNMPPGTARIEIHFENLKDKLAAEYQLKKEFEAIFPFRIQEPFPRPEPAGIQVYGFELRFVHDE